MNAHVLRKNLLNSIKETTEATERLSSGKRINSASDDPAVIGKISRLNSDIGSITEVSLKQLETVQVQYHSLKVQKVG